MSIPDFSKVDLGGVETSAASDERLEQILAATAEINTTATTTLLIRPYWLPALIQLSLLLENQDLRLCCPRHLYKTYLRESQNPSPKR